MNLYDFSISRKIFINDKTYVIKTNNFDIKTIKTKLLRNTEGNIFDAMQNKSVFIGKINDAFSINRNFLIMDNEGNFAKMYHVKGVFKENYLLVKFNFAFPNFFFFIWLLLFPLMSILAYIFGTNQSLIYFGFWYYIFSDILYNLTYYYFKNTFQKDFTRFLELDL